MYNVYGMYNVIADVVYYLFMQGFLRLKKKISINTFAEKEDILH